MVNAILKLHTDRRPIVTCKRKMNLVWERNQEGKCACMHAYEALCPEDCRGCNCTLLQLPEPSRPGVAWRPLRGALCQPMLLPPHQAATPVQLRHCCWLQTDIMDVRVISVQPAQADAGMRCNSPDLSNTADVLASVAKSSRCAPCSWRC